MTTTFTTWADASNALRDLVDDFRQLGYLCDQTAVKLDQTAVKLDPTAPTLASMTRGIGELAKFDARILTTQATLVDRETTATNLDLANAYIDAGRSQEAALHAEWRMLARTLDPTAA